MKPGCTIQSEGGVADDREVFMNRLKLAVAVAGALAVPGAALAQSSVTISGYIKVAMENIKLGDSARPGANTSENRLAD